MRSVTRWDPFREMYAIQRMMDRMLDESLANDRSQLVTYDWSLPLDVVEKEDSFVVTASVPGLKPEDLDITFTNNTLTIQGETHAEEEKEDEHYHLRERRFGKFSRSITFPTRVNGDHIEAHYENGELKLSVPKAEEVKPRRIRIQNGGKQDMIEG